MDVKVVIDGDVHEVIDYSVSEDATPLSAGDSSGSVGSFTVTLPMPTGDHIAKLGVLGSRAFMQKSIEVHDSYNGVTKGTVVSVNDSYDGATVSLTCVSRLAELNVYNIQALPFIGTLENAFEYYVSLAGIDTDVFVDPSIASRQVKLPGFTGELWYYLKQLAVAQDCDISLVSGVILLRPIRQRVAEQRRDITRSVSWGGGPLAQAVEVYWYDTEEITGELVYPPGGWNPDVQVLNVNAGETAEYQLPLDASLFSIQTPVMSTFVAEDYDASSVYTVVADDGLPVPPALWAEKGGKVEVILNPDTSSLTVKLTGATDIPVATGNTSRAFSLALASDTTGSRYSTLRIVGTGVRYTRVLRRFRTGVPESKTSTVVGETIDNRMLTDFESVMRAGVRAAKRWTGLAPALSGSVTAVNRRGDTGNAQYPAYGFVQDFAQGFTYGDMETDFGSFTYGQFQELLFENVRDDYSNQVFGNVAGARVYDERTARWFRVRSGNINHSGISFSSGDDDLLYLDMENAFSGETYGDIEISRTGFTYEENYMMGATLG